MNDCSSKKRTKNSKAEKIQKTPTINEIEERRKKHEIAIADYVSARADVSVGMMLIDTKSKIKNIRILWKTILLIENIKSFLSAGCIDNIYMEKVKNDR